MFSLASKFTRKMTKEATRPAFQLAAFGSKKWLESRKRVYRQTSPILIACFPKSGSTYLSELLCGLTGLSRGWLGAGGPLGGSYSREQDAMERHFWTSKRTVIQQHVKATKDNLDLFADFNVRPIVLTRNIFDIVPSIRDHWLREGVIGLGHYVPQSWFQLSEAQQYSYIIKMIVPWYFHFFVSWLDGSESISTLNVTYEELFSQKRDTIRKISAFYGFECSEHRIDEAINTMNPKKTRFNKGVSGRGKELLTREHIEEIVAMAGCTGISTEHFQRMGIFEIKSAKSA